MKKSTHEISDSTSSNNWTVIEGATDNGPIIVRVLEGFKNKSIFPKHQFQIGVAVPLLKPSSDGLPMLDESKDLEKIEDDLYEALKKVDAVFTAVISTGGMREFVFYVETWEPEEYERLVNKVQDKYDQYDLQFMMQEDFDRMTIKSILPSKRFSA